MTHAALEGVLDTLPANFPGPGGAVAVVLRGVPIALRAWGWADVERRVAFTDRTLFRICSITKQFTCAAAIDLDTESHIAASLPHLPVRPNAAQLMHNQSGLRDYWATTSICGAAIERTLDEADAARQIALSRTVQFDPGMRYSYCNQNFRILGNAAEAVAGHSLEALIRARVLDPAGMAGARMVADTAVMPDGTLGYEGSVADGFRPAVNRITWTGDAGLVASLSDMAAYEAWVDATRDDAGSLYRRLSAPVTFADGAPAAYGYGLARFELCGRAATGHGGGLRGWSSFRCHVASERLSVVVLFNHHADARAAVGRVAAAILGQPARPSAPAADPSWNATYEEPETGLVVRAEAMPDGQVALWFAASRPEMLDLTGPDAAGSGPVRIARDGGVLTMARAGENMTTRLVPLTGTPRADLAGTFANAEYGAELTCIPSGGAIYAAFSGWLGSGLMQMLIPAGPDLWRMPCPRALDHSPPGDWTLRVRRDPAGRVAGVTAGCWLARGIGFAAS